MSNPFAEFADAVTSAGRVSRGPDVPQLSQVAVLGGGPDARLIAALCLSNGAEVTLFSAYGTELEALRASSGITLRGAGPVGTYHVDRDAGPSVRLTAELDRAVTGAQVIFLTGPIHKQRTYAMVLADHLAEGQVLVLPQARSFGALETRWLLAIGGVRVKTPIAEAALPYWVQPQGSVLHLTQSGAVPGAYLPSVQGFGTPIALDTQAQNVLHSSFADASGAVDLPALLMGGAALTTGGPEVPMGGTPLSENQTFANLIGPEQRQVISDLIAERRATAYHFGVRDLPETDTWIAAHCGALKGDTARPVPSKEEAAALIRDGVIGSLVPLTSAAQIAGVATPVHDAMITLASSVLGADLATAGRKLQNMGFDQGDLNATRRALELVVGDR